jgi:RimJ/RimL family protein N-acetyltransferase
MHVGEVVPATTIALADSDGAIIATAHAYRPHNIFSPFHDVAWGGLVAVAESQRGRKLGSYVNAMIVRAAFERLDAGRIYELASATNLPSRRMIESCGLKLEPKLKSGNATAFKEKFTR